MTLRALHEIWAWIFVLSNAAVGAWALAAHRWPQLRHRSLWWATIAAELTVFVQVGLGVALQNELDVETDGLHVLYGFAGIITVAIAYSYRPQLRHAQHLLYGGAGLFIAGLGIRAMLLGPV